MEASAGAAAKRVAAADARILSPELRSAAIDRNPKVRGHAIALIAQLEVDAARPLLELAVADIEPGIRLDAARGIAHHPGISAAEREQELVGAFAAASSPAERAAVLGLLADVWPNAESPVLAQLLRSSVEADQIAACEALGRLAHRGHAPSPEVATAALGFVIPPQLEVHASRASAAARRACTYAFAEPTLAARASADPRLAELGSGVLEYPGPSLEATIEALTQLGVRIPAAELEVQLLTGTMPVALAALRSLRASASTPSLTALARRVLERPASELGTDRLHVTLAALEALEPAAEQAEVAALAEHALARFAPQREPARVALGRALAHCAAAKLADLGRQWPKALFRCGAGIAPDSVRDTWIAQVIARAPDSHALRATQLRRISGKLGVSTRGAVLRASASLPPDEAVPLLMEALDQPEPAVLVATLRAIQARAAELRTRPELVAAVLAAGARAEPEPEVAIAFVHAVQNLIKPSATNPLGAGLKERLTRLAQHAAPGVHAPARALLAEWQLPAPQALDPVKAPITAEQVPAADAPFHVKLTFTSGASLELALDTQRAPVAARAFVELVQSGALTRLPVASVVAGQAVAFLPPGPAGFALRHEAMNGAIEKGSVVLQDHGRDVVGPGFAIVLARSPRLDRRVQRVGQVLGEITPALALHLGDSIASAEVIKAR